MNDNGELSMKGNKFLSEAIDMDDLGYGVLNVIKADCGAGKTTFALNTLKQEFKDSYMLYLIDTTKGKNQLLQHDNVYVFDGSEWGFRNREVWGTGADTRNIIVMTYYQFGILAKNGNKYVTGQEFLNNIDILVCDELHNLDSFCKWEQANGTPSDKAFYQTAVDAIFNLIELQRALVVAMSATPQKIEDQFSYLVYYVPINEDVFAYDERQVEEYNNLTLLLNRIPTNQKGLIYIPHITQMEQYIQLLKNKGINAVGIWSEHNTKHIMTDYQKEVNNYIIENSAIPDDVQVLFINKSCETSVNIKSHLDYIIVHSTERDVQIQARGRYRDDIEALYLFDSEIIDDIELPEGMLGKRLSKADIDAFIAENNIKGFDRHVMKQPTFLKLVESYGYKVEKKKIKGYMYTVITQ